MNSCLKERCTVVTEVRHENVTKNMCRTEPRDPVCIKETFEDCHDSCQTVNEVVPVEEETEKCSLVNEQICNDVSKEVCDFNEGTGEGKCPITPALSGSYSNHRLKDVLIS